MRDFNPSAVEYLGKTLSSKPDDWGRIGDKDYSESFGYMSNGHYLAATKHESNGEQTLVRALTKSLMENQ